MSIQLDQQLAELPKAMRDGSRRLLFENFSNYSAHEPYSICKADSKMDNLDTRPFARKVLSHKPPMAMMWLVFTAK